MKKLRLDLEAIAVETFETAAVQAEKGTVLGQAEYTAVWEADTCQESCNGSCESCDGCTTTGDDGGSDGGYTWGESCLSCAAATC